MVYYFLMCLFCYLVHAYIWINYSEAYSQKAWLVQFPVNAFLLILTAKLSFLAFGNWLV